MGFYTLRLTCATIPANATMLTGGIGYTYALGSRQSPSNPDLDFVNNTQPLTQINLAAYPYAPNKKADGVTPGYGGVGGLIVPPPDVSMVATGFTGRRAIVDNSKCGSCHVSLGVGPDFHAGQRNDAGTCNWCHRPNQTSSALVGQRQGLRPRHPRRGEAHDPVHLAPGVADGGLLEGDLPGRAQQVRDVPPGRDVRLQPSAAQAAYPNMLASTVGQGSYAAGSVHAPYVTEGTAYGAGFSYNALTAATVNPDPTTLIVSPMVAACASCHDTPIAIDHMQTNGGSFYESRASVARQAAAGRVHAVPRSRPRRRHRRPPRVLALIQLGGTFERANRIRSPPPQGEGKGP